MYQDLKRTCTAIVLLIKPSPAWFATSTRAAKLVESTLLFNSSSDHFITCFTLMTRANKVETAVHGCNSWLLVWTLSCRCSVKLSV